MGYHGNEKIHQMMRSILPAQARARKKFKRQLKKRRRKNRHQASENLHSFQGLTASEAMEEYEDSDVDFEEYIDMHKSTKPGAWEDNGDIVDNRREADHLNHFMRWAREVTRNVPADQRQEYIRNLIPNSFIGDHAITHVMWVLDPKNYDHYDGPGWDHEFKKQKRQYWAALEKAIRKAAKDDKQRFALNSYLLDHCKTVETYERLLPGESYDGRTVFRDVRDFETPSYWATKKKTTECKVIICANIPQMNGAHRVNWFIDQLHAGFNKDCTGSPHIHRDWHERASDFLEIDIKVPLYGMRPL